jgi:hypothetical protein
MLWRRDLDVYPDSRPRILYLAIVVLAAIMLYYELYMPGAVSPAIIAQYHMSFSFYVYIIISAALSWRTFYTVYFTTVYGFSLAQANALGN